MRIALIVNAASGSGTEETSLTDGLRARGATVREVALDALDGLTADPPTDLDRIVAAGGDGTAGPAAALAAAAGVPLALIPTGTANDLARALGLPQDDLDAALDLASGGTNERRVDVADAGGVPFVNAASAGLAVRAAERATPLKRVLGPLAYAAGALSAGLTAQPLRVHVRTGEETLFSGRAWQVIVAGTGAFGGGSHLEEAEPGALDVAVVAAGPRWELARRAQGMRRGDLTEQDGVVRGRAAAVTVEGPETFNVDGEVRSVPGGRFTVGPAARVIVP
ncbi:hypothetical protein NBH00_24525 [Paraconexibacter antarcticus]|uniref:DAGKc domain-containing protein n=1 Tax=Paraconexibacter antarcticus TaxID=2949664 RepID=A0ABY5DSB3_9ACTN|nr:diacylglycerol kinase family protein [Paraconexibacter antarcticus]UTI64489.1 hypothetical protein NBH00_24525 [Paraconexibacter antarcticus]